MLFFLLSAWLRRLAHREARGHGEEDDGIEETVSRLDRNDPALRHLTIQGEQLSEDSLRRICQALRGHTHLETLTLRNMHFDKSWTPQWLVPSLRDKRLVLVLEDCSDDNESTLAMALAKCMYLQSVIISSCDLEPSEAWGELLRGNVRLSELRICYSPSLFNAGHRGRLPTITAISNALANSPALQILDLAGNGLGDESISILSQGLREAHTSQIELTDVPLPRPSLVHLSLDFNAFGDAAAASLAGLLSLPNCSLAVLSLFGNRITHLGAEALARSLYRNRSLTSLILSLNRIGDVGVAALARALTVNATLQTLWLPSNRFGVPGLQVLGDLLPHMQGLETLNVGMVLDQAAVDAICIGLQSNVHLNRLHMELAVPDESTGDGSSDGADFWLRLNRSGRRVLLRNDTDLSEPSLSSDASAPPGLCAKILAHSHHHSPCVPDVLYYMLKEKPELVGG